MENIVLKFGGTSVAKANNWKTILDVSKNYLSKDERPFIVCSALSKISDGLIQVMEQALALNYEQGLEEIKSRHIALMEELNVERTLLDAEFEELEKYLLGIKLTKDKTPRLEAKVMGLGEIMSTKIGASFLGQGGKRVLWLDARRHLKSILPTMNSSSENYLNNICEYSSDAELKNIVNQYDIIVTQGFICSDSSGDCVLLGRGGSDTSASYFASKLDALRCEIWTDVPGLFTADPFKIPQARLLKNVVYDEAREMASAGAKVLHPRCIGPAKKQGIPLFVKSIFQPEITGTRIDSVFQEETAQIKGICIKKELQLVSIDTVDMWQESGFLQKFLNCFSNRGISVDLISSSENQVTVSLDNTAASKDKKNIKDLLKELKGFGKVGYIYPCSSISFVGKNIRSILHRLTPLFEKLENRKIHLVSQSSNDLNLTLVMNENDIMQVLPMLHDQLFSETFLTEVYGPTWKELNNPENIPAYKGTNPWWSKKKRILLDMAKQNSPLYVYNSTTITDSITKLKNLKAVDKIFFSMKANNQKEVLKTVIDSGLGLECVSIEEINYVFDLFPELDSKRILFTPNFCHRSEYEKAFERNVFVTVDNIMPLKQWPELFRDKEIFLRIDVFIGGGHHKYVVTSGTQSKFGIPKEDLMEILPMIKVNNIKVIGLHTHNGSGISNKNTWRDSAIYLSEIKKDLPEIKYIDLGGGLGVPDKFGKGTIDLKGLDTSLLEFKAVNPEVEIWLEPGRFIVAKSGVLLAQVTQKKNKGDKQFIGINTGLNSLIRPALYGAYHEIVNLSKLDQPYEEVADIVGPICESGDTLGFSRKLPQTEIDDILLIDTAGAYGRVMSSQYNLRAPATEVFLEDK